MGRRKDEYQSHVVIYITFVPPPQRQKGGTAKKKTLLSWYEERVTQHYLLSPKLMALDNGQYRSSRANTQPMFLFFCLAFISCCFSCYLSFSLIFLLTFFLFSFFLYVYNSVFHSFLLSSFFLSEFLPIFWLSLPLFLSNFLCLSLSLSFYLFFLISVFLVMFPIDNHSFPISLFFLLSLCTFPCSKSPDPDPALLCQLISILIKWLNDPDPQNCQKQIMEFWYYSGGVLICSGFFN